MIFRTTNESIIVDIIFLRSNKIFKNLKNLKSQGNKTFQRECIFRVNRRKYTIVIEKSKKLILTIFYYKII